MVYPGYDHRGILSMVALKRNTSACVQVESECMLWYMYAATGASEKSTLYVIRRWKTEGHLLAQMARTSWGNFQKVI